MLIQLTIRNYALIRQLEFQPGPGLNAITGETGAGKSILLGALGLLLGNRADTKVLLDQQEKCVTEGVFNISGYGLEELFASLELDTQEETILRREISPAGKSRAFINDTPVNLETLRSVGYRLMDIHSQHETLELGGQRFQLRLIDTYAVNHAERKDYSHAWDTFRATSHKLEELEAEAARMLQEDDFVRFQLAELEQAALVAGEETELDARLKRADNAELILEKLKGLSAVLSGEEFAALRNISEARSILNSIAPMDPAYAELHRRIESVRLELQDIAGEAEQEAENIDIDPEETLRQRNRLDMLYTLQRKHRVSSNAELIAIRNRLQQQAMRSGNLQDEIEKAKQACEQATSRLATCSKKLTVSRRTSLPAMEKEMIGLLVQLGIPDARIAIEHRATDPGPEGADALSIMFSANKGVSPRSIAEAASGGEFSRLMLVIKHVLASRTAMPTLVLDEIDSGVSGDVALRMGRMMEQLGSRHQVIAISHLPQIAARASRHFVVFKEKDAERAASSVRQLEDSERPEEIARIISGKNPSASALQYARELMS